MQATPNAPRWCRVLGFIRFAKQVKFLDLGLVRLMLSRYATFLIFEHSLLLGAI